MSKRPLLSKSIVELEAMYEASGTDKKTADLLSAELNHRTTQKAAALKQRIASDQGKNNSPIPKAKTTPTETPRSSPPSKRLEPTPVRAASPTRPVASRPIEMPPITNKATDILSAWTALEVLSPQGFKKEKDIVGRDTSALAMFEKTKLPWEISQTSRPGKRLYFELYLGTIAMAPAVKELLKVYSDPRPEMPTIKGFSPIASVILDKEGRPLEEDESACISSFAWGVPVALRGDLRKLADWPRQQQPLTKAFREKLISRDRNNEIEPLTKGHIQSIYAWLVQTLDLGTQETKAPYFAVKRFEWMFSKVPPEPSIMNSFYLEDLEVARSLAARDAMPKSLSYYLGTRSPKTRTDLLEDVVSLQDLLQPKLTPIGRWPGNGRHPLALLQQAAVNATGHDQMPTGILGVNGPPGTGKTTLLRDVVAARVVERATVMASFQKPAEAFEPTKVTFQRHGATITLHRLDDRLKGFEMVVASTNNKAVENVSAELPSLEAVASDAPELRYFKTISDNVLKRESWGLIAAVLGKSANRFQFSQDFWKDDENGLSTYLNHASGQPQIVTILQEEGPPIKRLREIVERERPPQNAREAASRWETAKARFLKAKASLEFRQGELQSLHNQIRRLVEIFEAQRLAGDERRNLEGRAVDVEGQFASVTSSARKQEQALVDVVEQARRHAQARPGFFTRVFGSPVHKEWLARQSDLTATEKRYQQILTPLKSQASSLGAEVQRIRQATAHVTAKLSELNNERLFLEKNTKHARAGLGAEIPDAEFFGRPHEVIQLLNVWFDKDKNRLRDQVFEEAMRLHRAFIDCAADRIRQNLAAFMDTFGTRTLGTLEKDALIPEMWASFFLVVPVISTTFASVHRMFSRLKPETLGWLLVDEAGQASPQAVVGAMMRTRRSIVVGDPLQVEPVVSLPLSLTEKICGNFGVDPMRFNAPEASVQTLADAASIYCARFPIGSGHRNVGAPLLVHRRCNSPMFDVSNEIAYANLMVQAKKKTPDNKTLGRSSWINVVSQASEDKWSAREGEVLLGMLRELRNGGEEPDFYVVTPFKIVQDSLRDILRRSGILDGWVADPWDWAEQRVGTVHTVQGREAGMVFFVLGAPLPSQNGARAWAGGRPNLVNVAATRAKTTLYVIGNRANWRTAGYFATLDRFLPDRPST